MSDKFDFGSATRLIQAVENTASVLDIKNEQMEKRFGALREGFKDAGYDKYALDMHAASNSINEVITQLHVISKHISEYAQRLKEV